MTAGSSPVIAEKYTGVESSGDNRRAAMLRREQFAISPENSVEVLGSAPEGSGADGWFFATANGHGMKLTLPPTKWDFYIKMSKFLKNKKVYPPILFYFPLGFSDTLVRVH